MELTLEISEKYTFNFSQEEFARLLKLNTAVDLYRGGLLSSGAAAEFVGDMSREEFLYECKKRGVEPQTYESIEELEKEVTLLDRELP